MEARRARSTDSSSSGFRVFAPDPGENVFSTSDREFFLESMVQRAEADLLKSRLQLNEIQNGIGWKINKRIAPLGNWLFPERSWRKTLLQRCVRAFGLFLRKLKETKPGGVEISHGYEEWIKKNEPSVGALNFQRTNGFSYSPKISIVTPVWNTPSEYLEAMICSVVNQTYPNWELCLADGHSSSMETLAVLRKWADKEPRLRLKNLTANLGIAGNSNEALGLASGDFVALLDHDDLIPPFALWEIVQTLQNIGEKVDLIYSDEDMINSQGTKRYNPVFKSAFGWETLRSHNYICHLTTIRKSVVDKIGGFRPGFDGSQDYDLIFRACEQAREIRHIPKVLYHWRVHSTSTAGNPAAKSYAHEAGRRALQDHLDRVEGNAQACHGMATGLYQTVYHFKKWPMVSVIIPNRDQAGTLKKCLDSLYKEQYSNWEFLVLENGSKEPETRKLYDELRKDTRVRVLNWNAPFSYAAINNYGASEAKGDILLFLNNDVESLEEDNTYRLVEHARRETIGIAGAALFYPDKTFQHAGVILGMTGIAGHYLRHAPQGSLGYGFRLAGARNLSCVTGACLAVRKRVFQQVGGFDEKLAIAFNDIDLCLKIRGLGLSVVWTPHARYLHHESKTRGAEDTPEKKARFQKEINYFQDKWGKFLEQEDPFYSPNLCLRSETPKIRSVE